MAYWTHYWTNNTVEMESALIADGASDLVAHTAGEQFVQRGVSPGDVVYLVSRIAFKMHLLGRLVVDRVVDQSAANAHFRHGVWPATDHLLARPPFSKFRTDVVVPDDRLKEVEFLNKKGTVGLAFNKQGQVDQQTLRTLREVTAATAGLFDSLL